MDVTGEMSIVFKCKNKDMEFCMSDAFLIQELLIKLIDIKGKELNIEVLDFDIEINGR